MTFEQAPQSSAMITTKFYEDLRTRLWLVFWRIGGGASPDFDQ